jgi:hypothetical protein
LVIPWFARHDGAAHALDGNHSTEVSAGVSARRAQTGGGSEVERALRGVGKLLFLGLVEAFVRSMRAAQADAVDRFSEYPKLEVRENFTRAADLGLDERLIEIREELAEHLFQLVPRPTSETSRCFAEDV